MASLRPVGRAVLLRGPPSSHYACRKTRLRHDGCTLDVIAIDETGFPRCTIRITDEG
ncbi:hypothetical protein [Nocardia abscessus]|uniref:hypothetical protein n=1 Tax=Nocardia abscessus TaxID=120957 RepID=UPI0024574E75|nr:hypothetical protein [Nocardia abscessus]